MYQRKGKLYIYIFYKLIMNSIKLNFNKILYKNYSYILFIQKKYFLLEK